LDKDLEEHKLVKNIEKKNLEENFQKNLDSLEEEIKSLEEENKDLGVKLEDLEKISLEVNKKEKELNNIKKGWDELWEQKGNFEVELKMTSDKMENLPVLKRKKKIRKSVFK